MRISLLSFLFFLIISKCFGQISNTSPIKPSDKIRKKNSLNNNPNAYWETYMAEYEDGPGTVFLNMELYNKLPKRKFRFLLMTGINFTDCDSNGFPTKSEFNNLNKICDTIYYTLSAYVELIRTGWCIHGHERLDYFYLADTTGIKNLLSNKYSDEFNINTPYINIREDKNWSTYLDYVYPNEVEKEYIKNKKLILDLNKEGDNLNMARNIEHCIYFKNEKNRESFIQSINELGFVIKDKSKLKSTSLKFKLQISRVDILDVYSITKLTLELKRLAVENHGKYDSWATYVIK